MPSDAKSTRTPKHTAEEPGQHRCRGAAATTAAPPVAAAVVSVLLSTAVALLHFFRGRVHACLRSCIPIDHTPNDDRINTMVGTPFLVSYTMVGCYFYFYYYDCYYPFTTMLLNALQCCVCRVAAATVVVLRFLLIVLWMFQEG